MIYSDGPIALIGDGRSRNAGVFFSMSTSPSSNFSKNPNGTATAVKKMQTNLEVAYWGEDNKFPQNIDSVLSYCGIAKSALDWKARVLFGNGIIPGKVIGYDDKGTEIFQALEKDKYKEVYNYLNSRSTFRFFLEYLQDWTTFFNCFPEAIFSNDCKKITGFVHQESCDARFKQMNDEGQIDTVYLSKLWGASKNQYALFDPKKSLPGLVDSSSTLSEVDNKFIKQLDCIDPYNSLESTKKIAEKLQQQEKRLKSAILPVNYPSINKTYYQVPYWDGARLAGWIELATKVPNMFKAMYNKAFKLKYHIEVPEQYFPKKYGKDVWDGYSLSEKKDKKDQLLDEMNEILTSSEEDATNTFLTFFDIDPIDKKTEFGRVKITTLEDKSTLDKELLLSTSANVEILMAMQIHPTLFSAGMTGKQYGGGSGSDIREAFAVYTSLLSLERNVLLEPIYLMRDYNREVGGMEEWGEDVVFRFRDTILTTLDTGKSTKNTLN